MELERTADEVLMRRVCERDVDAFRVLYSRYEARIFRFVLRYTENRSLAEDLLQETFFRVWQAARTFDAARGEFRPWLYRVALNTARSELARKRHSREHQLVEQAVAVLPAPPQAGGDPVSALQERQTRSRVYEALESLSPALREIVILRCVEGMKFREIASATGAPVGTLKSRFHRAVGDLRRLLLLKERSGGSQDAASGK